MLYNIPFLRDSSLRTRDLLRLVSAEGLQLKVSIVGGDRQDAQCVGVAQSTLPALNGYDGGTRLDDVQCQGIAQTKSDSVVDLSKRSTCFPG